MSALYIALAVANANANAILPDYCIAILYNAQPITSITMFVDNDCISEEALCSS